MPDEKLNEARTQATQPDGPQRAPTFGEQLVGIGFNPAGDDKVAKAK